MNVDKTKLVLTQREESKLNDQPLSSKKIGYYMDSWIRFKNNRASLIAFIIICIMLFFVAFGPLFKNYDLPFTNPVEARRIGNLNPRIKGLEKLGIFNGTKTITKGKDFLLHIYNDPNGKGIILSGMPEELKKDPNHPKFNNVSSLTVKVDYYKYVDYINSYIPEDYYAKLNQIGSITADDPFGSVRKSISQQEFEDLLKRGLLVDILNIVENENNGVKTYSYEVRIKQFEYALGQKAEDTYFWFGTTSQGRDLFTEIWKGARISLLMALSVLIVNTIIGLTIGSIVGYYGGVVDLLFDRFVEIVSSIPFLSLISLLTLRFGTALWVVIFAFTATGWIGSYATGRMQFYRFKNREYVLAAKTLGASDARIMFKHIFPNTLGYIVTGYALAIPAFVFTEATFSFLGIIRYDNATSVGKLIEEGQAVMATHPHLLLFPALYIAILMIAFNLFGNGLRDAFNPSLRGAE